MSNIHASRQLTVCLISKHPGLLPTFERILTARKFKVLSFRFAPEDKQKPDYVNLPNASVFLLDASSYNREIEAVIGEIRNAHPQSHILVVDETLEDDKVFTYLRMRVKGVMLYADARVQAARAVKALTEGEMWIPRDQLLRFVDSLLDNLQRSPAIHAGDLSVRERQVFTSILKGMSNKEIGDTLHISESTVKFHVSRILEKCHAKRRSDLIAKHAHLWTLAA